MGKGRGRTWLVGIVVVSIMATLAGAPSAGQAETTFQRILRQKAITFGFSNEPPYSIAAVGGKITGVIPDIIKAVMSQYGVNTDVGVLAEFSSMIPGLLAKRFDMIGAGMAIRSARCKQIDFSNPAFIVRTGLAVKKGNPLNLHSLKDIAANPKARVATLQGAVENQFLETAGVKPNQIFGFPDDTAAMEALRTDRVDAFTLGADLLGPLLIATKDPNLERVERFEAPLDKAGKPIIDYQAVGFRKEDRDLRDAFNKGLKKLRENGQLATIMASYGYTKDDLAPANITAEEICASP